MACEASPEAISKLRALIHSDDERIAYLAATAILDRAFGKPKDYDPAAEKKARPIDLSRLSDEELDAYERLSRKASDAG